MSGWRKSRLGSEIELAYGKSLPANAREAGPFSVFGSNGVVGKHTDALVSGPGIIVGRKGSVGEVVFSEEPFWPIDTTYFVVNKGNHDWRYLFHLIGNLGLDGLNSHSAVPGLNREDAYSINVSWPEPAEQRLIAQAIDTIEASISLEQRALAETINIKSAAMRELFTRGLRGEAQTETEIGLVPESWLLKQCEFLAKLVTVGVVVRPASYYVGKGVPAFRSLNVREDWLDVSNLVFFLESDNDGPLRKSKLAAGDVLVVRTGYPGTSCVVPTKYAGSNCIDIVIVRPDIDVVLPTFLSRVFNSDAGKSQALAAKHGLAQQHLNVGALKRVKVPLPPTLDEQREIVTILDAIDQKIDLHKRKRAVLEDLFKTLLRKLMTGEIRVTDLDLSALKAAEKAEAAE